MKKLNLALILILGFVFACKKDDNGNGSNGNTNGTSSEIIKDIDGNVYTSIVIVDTEWMVENLKTTRYCNGDEIRNLTSDTEWSDPEATGSAGAWSYYNNDSSYNEPYGKLYNWFAVNDQRGVCPCGWRVPSITEWIQLIREFGSDSIAGGKLKVPGTDFWATPNLGATNESGFSGLPGGYRDQNGTFDSIHFSGYWWDALMNVGAINNLSHVIRHNTIEVESPQINKKWGLSVRCVRDK